MNDIHNKENTRETDIRSYMLAIVIMGVFTFIFLCTEYLYVNRISGNISENKTVLVQNYALGVSALGFVLYPVLNRYCKKKYRKLWLIAISVISLFGILAICQSDTYEVILIAGFIVSLMLGMFGSGVFYTAAYLVKDDRYLARTAGLGYVLGILLQFINNNLIPLEMMEAIVLDICLLILIVLLIKLEPQNEFGGIKSKQINEASYVKEKRLGIVLILLIILMSCIFSTLDNAVTLVHAAGTFDIGQLPRILLAVSGLVSGFLFDLQDRKYMSLSMYCMMLVSTICIAVFKFSGPFLAGLIVFYLTAGFFVVFFTTSFMELSLYMKRADFWAGLGRAVNNITAAVISIGSLKLLSMGINMLVFIFLIGMFIAVSIIAVLYTFQRQQLMDEIKEEKKTELSVQEKIKIITERYALTPREKEVFYQLVFTEDSIQKIADRLYISKRTLERHISSIYEKTGMKSRVGLINIYNKQ